MDGLADLGRRKTDVGGIGRFRENARDFLEALPLLVQESAEKSPVIGMGIPRSSALAWGIARDRSRLSVFGTLLSLASFVALAAFLLLSLTMLW
jgi:hypothetical protein